MRKHVVENMVDKKKVVEEMVGKPHAQRLDSPCTIAQLWHRPSCEFDPGEKKLLVVLGMGWKALGWGWRALGGFKAGRGWTALFQK